MYLEGWVVGLFGGFLTANLKTHYQENSEVA